MGKFTFTLTLDGVTDKTLRYTGTTHHDGLPLWKEIFLPNDGSQHPSNMITVTVDTRQPEPQLGRNIDPAYLEIIRQQSAKYGSREN